MDTSFLTYILSIPSCTDHEEFLTEKIEEWCAENGIKTKKDGAGNLYLTKGTPKSGEFYVGATAHLDTVQHEQIDYIKEKKLLEPKVEGDKITMWMGDKQTGTGSDDKNAIAIILSMMKQVRAMKAAFYVGEEKGMVGAKASDMSFWDDVAWVFGCDSPGPDNRATKYTSGVKLFTDEFFDEYLGPVCKKHGITDFRSEAFTDLATLVRRGASDGKFVCSCNLRNGGEAAHSSREWCSIRVANDTEQCGLDLVKAIPLDKRHVMDKMEEPRPSYGFSYSSYAPSYSGSWRSPYSPWGSSLRQGAFSFGSSQSPRSDEKGSFVYAFSEKKARDEFVEKYMELPNVAKYLKREDVGVQSVRVSGERLYCRFAWLAAYNYDTGSSWKTWSEFEAGEPMAAREFERAFRPDEAEEEPAPEGLEGEAAYEFSSKIAAQRFVEDYVRQAKDVTGWPEKGNVVGMRGTRLALAKAWINAVASDKDEPGIAKSAEKDEGGWTEFSGKYPASAAAFEAAFKPSEKAAAPDDLGHGSGTDVAVFVQADDPDDQAVIQDQILDRNIAVDIDFDPEGLFLTGLMKDVAEAWTVAKNVLDGTSYRSFRALSAADRLSAAEFFDAVDAGDDPDEDDAVDAEFSDDDDDGEDGSFDALDLIRPPKK